MQFPRFDLSFSAIRHLSRLPFIAFLFFVIVMNILMEDARTTLRSHAGDLANSIHEILYADDILLVDEDGELSQLYMNIIAYEGSHYGLAFNWDKLQYLSIRCDPELIRDNGDSIERVPNLKYLGGVLSSDGAITHELISKIGIAMSEFSNLQRIWSHSSISIQRKLVLFNSLILSK